MMERKGCDCACQEQLARELLGELRGRIAKTQIVSGVGDVNILGPDRDLELVGWSLTENAAAVARARFMEGQGSDNDVELYDVQLSASESAREWFANGKSGAGIPIPNGLFLDRVSGTTRGTVYWRRRLRLT